MLKHPETVTIQNIIPVDATGNPDWAFPLHTHEHCLEISIVQEGSGTFYSEGRSCSIHKGDLVIKNAGTVHGEHTSRKEPLKQICISFFGVNEIEGKPGCLIREYAQPVINAGNDFELLSSIFSFLAEHWQEEDKENTNRHLMLGALEIIHDIVQKEDNAKKSKAGDTKSAHAVKEAVNWINQNYNTKITLNMLAEKFYISPFYLERRFKEYTGYSISQYVIERRMGEAQRMLIFEDISIKEIALAVGYENIQYFYAAFKKSTGVTPLEFRNQFR